MIDIIYTQWIKGQYLKEALNNICFGIIHGSRNMLKATFKIVLPYGLLFFLLKVKMPNDAVNRISKHWNQAKLEEGNLAIKCLKNLNHIVKNLE